MTANYKSWGIYVHVPWCHRRCSYCDFYFEIGKSDENFSSKILEEWHARRILFPESKAKTLYFGGGTPSTLSSLQMARMISGIQKNDLLLDAEITMEANPEDLTPAYLSEIRQGGVNRLSLGIQSFDDAILKWLGRKHDGNQAKKAITQALDVGFSKLSVDMIVGVPGEDWPKIEASISWLKQVGVGHVSVYILTVEPMTPLAKMIMQGKRLAPIDDTQAQSYERVQAILVEEGFRQYEIASFAKPGEESQHNGLYWAGGEYLGLGPGAHSMYLQENGSIYRRHTTAILSEWIKKPTEANFVEEFLEPDHAFRESLAFGIRNLVRGVDVSSQLKRHKCPLPKSFSETVSNLIAQGWVLQQGACLHLTPLGARFADAVAREFLGM